MKTLLIKLTVLSFLQVILLAQADQSPTQNCSNRFDKMIAKGDEKALKSYIQSCHQKPNETLLQEYQIQTYTTLQATSLVCMGDYYAPRITHLSFLAYALAAKQESLAAKVSLGVMLNEPKFKKKLPLSSLQQKKYQKLAQEEHPYNHYETRLQLRHLDNKKEIKNYKQRHYTSTLKYANQCISALENDLHNVKNEIKGYHLIMQRKRNHDTELWANTEFHFAQTKQHRLEKTLKSFQATVSIK